MSVKQKTQSDQRARFIEAAKKAESELSGKAFEKAFKKIARNAKSKPPDPHLKAKLRNLLEISYNRLA